MKAAHSELCVEMLLALAGINGLCKRPARSNDRGLRRGHLNANQRDRTRVARHVVACDLKGVAPTRDAVGKLACRVASEESRYTAF